MGSVRPLSVQPIWNCSEHFNNPPPKKNGSEPKKLVPDENWKIVGPEVGPMTTSVAMYYSTPAKVSRQIGGNAGQLLDNTLVPRTPN